jgi:ubiquinone/menaquinone biosynthesis C-methylase UbiE
VRCKRNYKIIKGIPDLLSSKSKIVQQEIEGWEKFAKDEKWLAPPDEYLMELPRPKKKVKTDTLHWEWHADNFQRAIDLVDPKGKWLLDIAAGRCWTTKYLAQKGGRCVATDILTRKNIGLETGERYIKQTGKYFDRVACDMNNMPFQNNSFDIVFVYASMHHTEDLPKAIAEAIRVLKKGGKIYLTGEPVGRFYGFIFKHLLRNPNYQINETAPLYKDWIKGLRKGKIKNIKIVPDALFTTHSKHPFDRLFRVLYKVHPKFYNLKLRYLGDVLILEGQK